MNIPEFNTRKELFDFLVKNQHTIIAQKKAQMKRADAIIFQPEIIHLKSDINKDDQNTGITTNDVRVKVVINTTNLMDSCKDVHLPGLWSKSLKENKMIMHLQEHEMAFENIIADGKDLLAYAKTYSWGDLGYNFSGTTEALVFESLIKANRNPYMADQYKKGYVKNHSVGMQYVKMIFGMNDENYGAEYEAWQKYYPEIANKDYADEFGYAFFIKEAKVIEGSAVPRGSNYATPTLDVTESKSEPLGTHKIIEPEVIHSKSIDYSYLKNNLKIK